MERKRRSILEAIPLWTNSLKYGVDDGRIRVDHLASCSITVGRQSLRPAEALIAMVGVDACNTSLEVLLFAAAMNLGQGWKTVLTLFGSETCA